ncbi:hypothetical protein ACNOYE_32465 [Nannocystaceae bacterium ST9]
MAQDDRKYEPDEVALVLRRVAELQVSEQTSALTRAELEQVAAESGLDVRHLDRALAEIETDDKRSARRFGLRLFVVVHRSVAGELDQAALEAAAALLDRSLGVIGSRAITRAGLTWFGRHVAVSIQAEGGRISIQLEERFRNTVQGQVGMAMFTAVPAGALMTVIAWPVAPLLALIPLGLYAGVRVGHRRRIEATERQLGRIADQLVALLAKT